MLFMFYDPMEQFTVTYISYIFSNVSIAFLLIAFFNIFFYFLSSITLEKNNIFLIIRIQISVIYEVIRNNLFTNIVIYFPTMFVILLCIMCSNLCGIIPFFFTTTSLFVVTFFFSFSIICGTTIIGFDETKSIQKTLRKPADQLKDFKGAGKVKLRTFLDDIKTTDTKLNGRCNPETVLLKVI